MQLLTDSGRCKTLGAAAQLTRALACSGTDGSVVRYKIPEEQVTAAADPEPGGRRAVRSKVPPHRIFFAWLIFVCGATSVLQAETTRSRPWLEDAVEKWLGERDHWAFTQRAVEYDNGKPRERLERYDPSKFGNERWTLLAINGRPPTADQHAAWAKKKFKKNRRRFDSPIGDYFDFADAKVISETPKLIHFDVPLRRDKNWLFQTDKVRVVVTVNKETRALEHLKADVREPVKVLLGLAKITNGRLDLSFLNFDDDAPQGPETTQPTGTAHVTVSKFGERAEFTWSDFKRVTPATDTR